MKEKCERLNNLGKGCRTGYVVPANVLDGYPQEFAALLPDLIGTRIPFPGSYNQGDNTKLGRHIFLTYFPVPPWRCELCGYNIGWDDQLRVHHVNENRQDNRLVNLMPTHPSCHTRHHNKKRRLPT